LISAVGGGSGPRLEGIWFHPHALDRRWRYAPPLDRRWRERGRLHRWLKGPVAPKALGRLWFLAAEALERWRAEVPAVPGDVLPDPWERRTGLSREEARERLGLEQGRRIFLHLGSSERRKGLPDLLQAYEVALTEADRSARPLLLRVGPNERLRGRDRVRLARLVGRGDARVVEGFVPAEDLPAYFAACDWIVIPYRKFRYSSGVLANAAGMGRPVIAPAYGEIGRRVAGEGLGGLYREGSRRGLARRLIEAFAGGAESRPPKGPGPGDFVAVIESRARGAR
jgi:glycosyltransferase involved in cell wall biosynthesis